MDFLIQIIDCMLPIPLLGLGHLHVQVSVHFRFGSWLKLKYVGTGMNDVTYHNMNMSEFQS